MTETKIYVGLNDSATKQQEHLTELYVKVMKHVCQSFHVSFSFVVTEGGYFHENGDYVQEKTLVLSLIDPEAGVAETIAKELCAFFHQESVLITQNQMSAYYVKEDLLVKKIDKDGKTTETMDDSRHPDTLRRDGADGMLVERGQRRDDG